MEAVQSMRIVPRSVCKPVLFQCSICSFLIFLEDASNTFSLNPILTLSSILAIVLGILKDIPTNNLKL